MIVLAVVVQMVGLAVLIQFNIGGVTTNVVPFFWLAAMVGELSQVHPPSASVSF